MRAREKERLPKSFIMPDESCKWDFILEKHAADDAKRGPCPNGGRRNALMTDLTRITTSHVRTEDRTDPLSINEPQNNGSSNMRQNMKQNSDNDTDTSLEPLDELIEKMDSESEEEQWQREFDDFFRRQEQ